MQRIEWTVPEAVQFPSPARDAFVDLDHAGSQSQEHLGLCAPLRRGIAPHLVFESFTGNKHNTPAANAG